MSLASQIQSLATRIGTEFKTIRTEIATKLTIPSGGSTNQVLTKTNNVDITGGGTYSWQSLPARTLPTIFYAFGKSGAIWTNPGNYIGSDLLLIYGTGELYSLLADVDLGNSWSYMTTLALASSVNTKAQNIAIATALGG
jgi:hypothetical protein